MTDVATLAQSVPPEILFGTSTWTYPGWKGIVYNDYPANRTAADALAEYAKCPLFRSVGIDSFFYRPPDARTLASYAEALPVGFKCCSKVWQNVTAHTFKGPNATKPGKNTDWLNPQMFIDTVLGPMQEHFSDHLGPLIFELEAIPKGGLYGDSLAELLDLFFSHLPQGPQYAVELRNPELLDEEYLSALWMWNVAHVFNAWTRMPTIGEQLTMYENSVSADFIVSRALLTPGRKYAAAVEAFAPYDHIQAESPELRNDLVALARTAIKLKIPAYVIVNNRAEGCAPATIEAVARRITAGD